MFFKPWCSKISSCGTANALRAKSYIGPLEVSSSRYSLMRTMLAMRAMWVSVVLPDVSRADTPTFHSGRHFFQHYIRSSFYPKIWQCWQCGQWEPCGSVVLPGSSRPIQEIALTHQFSREAGIIIFLQHYIHSSIYEYGKKFTKFPWSVSTGNPPLQLK